MKTVTLSVDKKSVLGEVAQTTAYTGAKMLEKDDKAMERIATVDEDDSALERFWNECSAMACKELVGLVSRESMNEQTGRWDVDLRVSDGFETVLTQSMEISLRGFFVTGITARWFLYTNKEESAGYATQSAGLLEDVKRKAYHKRVPEIPGKYRRE